MALITNQKGESLDGISRADLEACLSRGDILVSLIGNDVYHYYLKAKSEKLIGFLENENFLTSWQATRHLANGQWTNWRISIRSDCPEEFYDAVEAFLDQLSISTVKIE